jgi:hypothetical protein
MKHLLLVTFLVSTFTMSFAAQSEESGWTFSPFKEQSFEVGTATDKKGHHMMVIRMKDGSMMAVVPATPLWDLMKSMQDDRS